MTSVPEVVLAKELGMCYSTIGRISNWCTGMSGEITLHDIQGVMEKNKERITDILIKIFQGEWDQSHCSCSSSIVEL